MRIRSEFAANMSMNDTCNPTTKYGGTSYRIRMPKPIPTTRLQRWLSFSRTPIVIGVVIVSAIPAVILLLV